MLEIVASYHYMQFQEKLMDQTRENGKKLVLGLILPIWPKFRVPFFPQKIWLCHSLDVRVSYHHVQYQEKNNDPILRKRSDKGQTDRQTDQQAGEQTDKSDFIRCCPIYRSNTEKIND